MEHVIARPSRRERKRDRTRARLYEAALDEFRRAGFDRASVSRIARKAGVSRASFYFHYPTKEHVLLELLWGLQQRIAEGVARSDSLRDALHALVDGLIQAESSVADAQLHRDMLMIYVRRSEGLGVEDLPSPVHDELLRRFAAAAARGELRAGLGPEQANDLFLSGVFGLLIGTTEPSASRLADLQALASLFLEEGAA